MQSSLSGKQRKKSIGNALISLKPQYARKILAGEKTVELRRRAVNLPPGTRLWIYSTLPKACVEIVVTIDSINFDAPKNIWDRFASEICVTKREFKNYVSGCEKVSAIQLKYIHQVNPAPDLSYLRSQVKNFHPPQFFKNLSFDSPLLNFLDSLALERTYQV